MKNLLFFSFFLLLLACQSNKENNFQIDVKPVPVEVERFDVTFFTSKPSDLPVLKEKYPFMFPAGINDSVWNNKIESILLQDLYKEVQQKYADTDSLTTAFGNLFAHMQYYYPKLKTPKVITAISEVDRDAKAIYTDSLVLISLDCYLGENHKFYTDFPAYQRKELNRNQILPDIVTSFSEKVVPFHTDNTLLAKMIYYGKKLFMKDLFLPDYSDAAKIGYTNNQLQWCVENEKQMWSYFIENNLLYMNDKKLEFRFINKAPFSKFYLEIDNESPGRVGQWIGWQMVRSYMKNNNVSLQKMLETDVKTLFEQSKYKPAK